MWEIPHTGRCFHRGCGKFPTRIAASTEDVWNPPHALPSLCLTRHRTASVSFPSQSPRERTRSRKQSENRALLWGNLAFYTHSRYSYIIGNITYAAGELKHGTISLIEDGTLVIGVLTQRELYEKTISNMVECKSRGAYLMGLTTFGKYETEDHVDFTVYVPRVDEHFVGSLAVVPLQLLGYYVSVAKGLDVDKPRNLAKSVTVE